MSHDLRAPERSIEQLRNVLSMLCNYIWTKELRPGEHLWSIPVDKARDFDCILSDAIDELEARRAAAVSPPQTPEEQDLSKPAVPKGSPMTPDAATLADIKAEFAEAGACPHQGEDGGLCKQCSRIVIAAVGLVAVYDLSAPAEPSAPPSVDHSVLAHKYNDRASCPACHLWWCLSRDPQQEEFTPEECNCDLIPAEPSVTLAGLIAKWRAEADERLNPGGGRFKHSERTVATLRNCADELEAALAASRQGRTQEPSA